MDNKAVEEWLKSKGIHEVECIISDITGNARGKFIPADKFFETSICLPEGILALSVTGEYTPGHDDIFDPTDKDMLLEPDYSTLRLVPWAKKPTAQLIHDCVKRDGELHPISSRNVLKRILSRYEEKGWFPVVAPEMEFYLIAQVEDTRSPVLPPRGKSGRRETVRQAYGIEATGEFDDFIIAMYEACHLQNLEVDTLVHESGAAQFEINFSHGNALNLADQVFTFKRTVREIAAQQGINATFMARPYDSEAGSAMHIHQSVVDKEGQNIFVDDKGEENELFRWFIGGMQKYIPHSLSFFAPNINSYRRFSAIDSAPANMEWGYDNRTAGLRVPIGPPSAKRVENRFPGADVNPYLAMAASLACGLLGIENQLEPTAPNGDDAYEEGITVERNLLTSVALLDQLPELVEIFGKDFILAYQSVKRCEFEAANQLVTDWERENLLFNV
jgi:glutamine synthetase